MNDNIGDTYLKQMKKLKEELTTKPFDNYTFRDHIRSIEVELPEGIVEISNQLEITVLLRIQGCEKCNQKIENFYISDIHIAGEE